MTILFYQINPPGRGGANISWWGRKSSGEEEKGRVKGKGKGRREEGKIGRREEGKKGRREGEREGREKGRKEGKRNR